MPRATQPEDIKWSAWRFEVAIGVTTSPSPSFLEVTGLQGGPQEGSVRI